MAKQMEAEQVIQITRDARINASNGLWDAFNSWMDKHGYKTLAEGIRAAMVKVTDFEPESQEKSCPN